MIGLACSILGIYIAFLPALRRATARLIGAEERMWSHAVETIHGIRTVKSLSLDGLKRSQRDAYVAEVIEAHQAFDRLANIPQTMAMPLERCIYAGSFFIGCYMVLASTGGSTTASAGSIVAFAMLASRAAAPIVSLAGVLNGFEAARGAMAEVASVMVVPRGGRSGTGLKLPITGKVVFQASAFVILQVLLMPSTGFRSRSQRIQFSASWGAVAPAKRRLPGFCKD